MKVVPSDGVDVGQFAEENQAKWKELRQRREQLLWKASFVGLGGAASMVIAATTVAVMLAGAAASLPSLSSLLGELQTISQRFLLMSDLIEAFENEDISIEVSLKPDGVRDIDFFLRFPNKEFVLIQVRSLANSKIVYNEKLEALQYRRKGGTLKTWKPDPFLELVAQEQWIRKESGLMGATSNDKRRPMAKLLVLWTDTQLGDLSEGLYAKLNESKYATIRRRSTFNVVPRDQVLDFIKDYLAFRRSPKTP